MIPKAGIQRRQLSFCGCVSSQLEDSTGLLDSVSDSARVVIEIQENTFRLADEQPFEDGLVEHSLPLAVIGERDRLEDTIRVDFSAKIVLYRQ